MEELHLEGLTRMSKDLANASKTLSTREARFLTDMYYMIQDNRISAGNQVRTLQKNEEPHEVLSWLGSQNTLLEAQIKRALDKWTDDHRVGVWAKSIVGIGPVISAGLLSNIDIERCPTAGHIWSFAGLNPNMKWEKNQKRPYNASLKTLTAFKLGESFVKVQNNDNDVYGKVYAARKKIETERNEAGLFRETAEQSIGKIKKKDTEAYKAYAQGKLPLARIHARARRYAVKLFLAHYHHVAYFHRYGVMPPFPYVFEHLKGHVDFIAPPNPDLIPGFPAALETYKANLRKKISGGFDPAGQDSHEMLD